MSTLPFVAVPCWRGPAGSSPRRATYFLSRQKVGKKRPLQNRPCAALRGPLRCSQPGGAPNSLRYAPFKQRGASQMLKRAARAPRVAALLGGLEGETRNSQQPNSQRPNATFLRSWLFHHSPLESAEQRKALRACAQRTSTSDFARLFERSVAKRVPREPSRPEQRRAARCEAKGRTERGRLFAFFLVAQKEGRPPGRRPGTVHRVQRLQARAPQQGGHP